jgi:hypothetical protein
MLSRSRRRVLKRWRAPMVFLAKRCAKLDASSLPYGVGSCLWPHCEDMTQNA